MKSSRLNVPSSRCDLSINGMWGAIPFTSTRKWRFWAAMARTCAAYRYRCARQTSPACSRAGLTVIFVAPFEQGEIGPDLFRAACNMGLEGLVSKRSDRPYRGGRSPDLVKGKNTSTMRLEGV